MCENSLFCVVVALNGVGELQVWGRAVMQPHLAQCYSRRIALMLNSVHESKIYFEIELGVNKLASGG